MKKYTGVVLGVMVGLVIGFHVWVDRSSKRMEVLSLLLSSGQERLMVTTVRSMLSHVAEMTIQEGINNPDLCKHFTGILERSGGLLAVVAVGRVDGAAVCSSDPKVKPPLPTMKERLYYERVLEADDLVMGEYAVSRTTGKSVLHFAYPIIDEKGERLGFAVAGVDLMWFVSPELNKTFDESGVEIKAVERNGKILFAYPSNPEQLGQNFLSAPLISAMLRGDRNTIVAKGYDGKYKMYGYHWVEEMGDEIAIVASVQLRDYLGLWLLSGVMGGLMGWVVVNIGGRRGKRG